MEKLRTPLRVTAVVVLLYALSTLSSSLVKSIYGYQVKDEGLLFIFAGAIFALFIFWWAIASNVGKYGGLATPGVLVLAIFVVFFLIGWARQFFTLRTVAIPVVIDVVLGAWIWSARPKS